MELKDIIRIASAAYPDDYIWNRCWDQRRNKPIKKQVGDTLATFIATEIAETYIANATSDDQLRGAMRALKADKRDLACVISALREREKAILRARAAASKK